ncbi:unnamed protein product [Durusdinium trenchii]|uniref:Uncharacterized protein n=1 Tax=Durusdinium trenchii TaxID=1381693 RepID=A0ABP0SMK8_9DINO
MACDRAQFGEAGQGHPFELRKPLAKPTARRCATCGADVLAHARGEVDDASFMSILNVTDDQTPSVVIAGELALGSFNAALRLAQEDPAVVVVNCAGTKLHDFLPQTRTVMEGFRATQRLLDLEWEEKKDSAGSAASSTPPSFWTVLSGRSASWTVGLRRLLPWRHSWMLCAGPKSSNNRARW